MALKLGTIDYNDSGDIVFSGKASPGATVRLYVDNRFLGDALVNGLGDWSFRGREQIKPGVHQIRADLLSKGGKVVQRTGVPFVRANPDRVAALLKTRTGNAGQPAPASPPAAPKTQQAVKKQPAPASLPPAAPVQEKQPAPAGPAPTAAKTLPRDVQKTARAAPGKPAFEKTASKAAPPVTAPQPAVQPEPVRLPQTAAQSQPAAKPATTREVQDGPPGQPAAAQEKLKTQVVIQPGNNLWNIARVIYGKGIQYTVIYEANKNQIRNPDLIYPGQIFITPGVATTGKVDPRQRRPLKQPAVQ
ncbi:MAG TPA: LysM peptidoglycan-binding domain-containing protein [Rhizobiales bacterium]|nr:LysM peptidoglycan-binding domain-containing protein [Hyphomicrobiales bacterium]